MKDQFQDYLKSISNGLFGRQFPYYTTKEEGPGAYPIGEMVQNLCKIEDAEWYKYAFSREPLNGRFSDETRAELTRKALECGERVAGDCVLRYGTNDPAAIAEKLELTVTYPNKPQNASRVLFAEFREPDNIRVYTDSVTRAEELFSEPGVVTALGENLNISRVLLAHEIFHYIEEQEQKDIWTRTYKIKLWAIGPLRNYSRVLALGEIAAMGFCKKITGLNYSPYVMDAFLMYGYSQEAAGALYREMMTLAGKTVD